MPEINTQRLQDCRFMVRRALYAKQGSGVDADSLRHQLTRWAEDFDNAEIKAAANFLCGLTPPQATLLPKVMGAVDYWQITTPGIVAFEANA